MKRDHQPDVQFQYFLTVPSRPLDQRSMFQGFTDELFDYVPILSGMTTLPTTVFDPSLPHRIRLARHAAGQSAWLVNPVTASSLITLGARELLERPFLIVFSARRDDAKQVSEWASKLPIPILHIAADEAEGGNTITADQLTTSRIQAHASAVIDALSDHYEAAPLDRLRAVLHQWKDQQFLSSRSDLVSHLATIPNLMTLAAGGIEVSNLHDPWTGKNEAEYITEIVKSCDAVQALRDDIPFQPLHRVAPAQPDVFVIAPAHYKLNWASFAAAAPKEQRSTVRRLMNSIVRQSGFLRNFGEAEDINRSPIAQVILRQRADELAFFAHIVGIRAASTLSAVVRVPPAVNRATGLFSQLGRLAREQDLRHRSKLERTFESVQKRLKDAVGADLIRCIEESVHGVKLISDAPIEWLPIGDLPLVLAHNTSRLTSTPGDLLVGQLAQSETLTIPVGAFDKILVVSAFKSEDPLGPLVRKSIELMTPAWKKDRLSITTVEVSNVNELVEAFNNFDGPLAIFDGHGTHDAGSNIGYLMIGDTPVDVWGLRGRIRVPPIVMLSACDTQAVDGSHATAANGFLSLGARAVVATLLPVHGVHASVFIARMMLRIAEFVPAAIAEYGRGVLWSEMVSGLQRMNLLSDVIMTLRDKDLIDDAQYQRLGTYGNGAINLLDASWLERIKESIIHETGMSRGEVDRRVKSAIATSDAIRYTQIGNPETIVIGNVGDVAEGLLSVDAESEDGIRLRELADLSNELRSRAFASVSSASPTPRNTCPSSEHLAQLAA